VVGETPAIGDDAPYPQLLQGLTVLEMSAYQSGTVGGALLGQLGARVIKIEQPGIGDPARGTTHISGAESKLDSGSNVLFETANTDKKSVAIDLGTAEGRDIAHKLVLASDAFLTNYREAVLERVGLSYMQLERIKPDLVYVRASASGLVVERDDRSFDWIGQALSGLMWACGRREDTEPSVIVGGPVDQLGGTLAAFAVVLGLFGRERFGLGQRADVSLLGAGIHLQTLRVNQETLAHRPVRRHGRDQSRQPLANWYQCQDGKWLMLCELQSDRFWNDFCTVIGRTDLLEDSRFASQTSRRTSYRELIAVLDQVFASRNRDEWLEMFRSQLPEFVLAPILELSDVVARTEVRANGYVTEFAHQNYGKTTIAGCPIAFSATPARIARGAPELGEHTEEVLGEVLGLSWDEIGQLREAGAI
jgi:crotonobetainyl-CoA:carnitine CoA-transferase CaiB-like acyl-CoA transferase